MRFQEKALGGAFSVIVKFSNSRSFVASFSPCPIIHGDILLSAAAVGRRGEKTHISPNCRDPICCSMPLYAALCHSCRVLAETLTDMQAMFDNK